MREIRQSGLEGGVAHNAPSLPLLCSDDGMGELWESPRAPRAPPIRGVGPAIALASGPRQPGDLPGLEDHATHFVIVIDDQPGHIPIRKRTDYA